MGTETSERKKSVWKLPVLQDIKQSLSLIFFVQPQNEERTHKYFTYSHIYYYMEHIKTEDEALRKRKKKLSEHDSIINQMTMKKNEDELS